jgi:hypothetical protein
MRPSIFIRPASLVFSLQPNLGMGPKEIAVQPLVMAQREQHSIGDVMFVKPLLMSWSLKSVFCS